MFSPTFAARRDLFFGSALVPRLPVAFIRAGAGLLGSVSAMLTPLLRTNGAKEKAFQQLLSFYNLGNLFDVHSVG